MLHAKAVTTLRKGPIASAKAIKAAVVKFPKNSPQRTVVATEFRAIAREAAQTGSSERNVANELLSDRLRHRATSRLKRKGKRRPDGSQQYFYPDPSTYVIVNQVTAELAPRLENSTVVWYSLRNTVE